MKKALSLLLALLFVIQLFPVSVFAEDAVPGTEETAVAAGTVDAGNVIRLTAADGEEEATVTWTVTIVNRDGQKLSTRTVEDGGTVGDLGDVPARADYTGSWFYGTSDGRSFISNGTPASGTDTVTADVTIGPVYETIKYTVTFYQEDKTTQVGDPITVDVNSSYCVNNPPKVPTKEGYDGKWVYAGGDFSNTVKITEDTSVWAEYAQNTFTVTFMVEGQADVTETYHVGDPLELPPDPVVEGKQFDGWFAGEKEYTGGEAITSDLVLTAKLLKEYAVSFVVVHDDGTEERLHQFFKVEGLQIETMPENPFVAGKTFESWNTKADGTGDTVTAATVVNNDITAYAIFRELEVDTITAEYYYLKDDGTEFVFETQIIEVDSEQLPYTITPPPTTQTDPDHVSGGPVYYPTQTSVTVSESDFTDHKATVRVQYVKFTATYDVVHMLKDLTGSGYSEIDRDTGVEGVLGSFVTPTAKTFDYAVLEVAEGATIEQASGQELVVKYTRKNFQLSYESNGGSYIAGTTVPYGSSVDISGAKPTKAGYTFDGWYLDEELSQAAGSSVTVEKDTTLYAKWKGDTVNYTIVYMFEKYNDTGTASNYVYDNSRDATGTVGTTVQASSAPSITRTGWEVDTAKNQTSSVEIAADGSSVLYVYYKLRAYTFNFRPGQYYNRNVTASLNGESRTGNNNWSYSFTAKLGQDISSLWISASNGTSSYGNVSFSGWVKTSGGSVYVTKRLLLTEDMLPGSGTSITYEGYWLQNTVTYTVNYMLQNADDDGYTRSEKYSQTYDYSPNSQLSPKDIAGYTYVRRTDSGNTANLYYDRDKFKIDYFYGSTNLDTISNVKFDANINQSPYVWTPTAAQCGVESDYTFDGWYSDSGLTAKYTFSTMPASNLVLYAKWNAPEYTINFLDDDGSTELSPSQTVAKHTKIERPTTPVKTGYTFEGWFTAASGGTQIVWPIEITADTTVYAHWTMDPLSYIVHYVDENEETVAPDKTVTNPNFVIGQEVTEQAVTVAGLRPDAASKKITLALTGNEITFVYSTRSETTTYKVKYLIEGTDIAVVPEKTEEVDGNTLSVIELAAAIDYPTFYAAHPEYDGQEFFPDKDQKELVLSAKEADNVITFYYSQFKSTTVTVNYVDMDGVAIPGMSAETKVVKVGNTFTLARPAITGWQVNKAVEGTSYSGTTAQDSYKITNEIAGGDPLTFTVFYQKKLTITAVSDSKAYDGEVLSLPEGLGGVTYAASDLVAGDSLTSVEFTYQNTDSTDPIGRLNAGTATVTPKNAVISGKGANPNYYVVHYISGTLEVTKLNVTVRIEPDRWSGNIYDGTEKPTGFTNPTKGIEDYVLISSDAYKAAYLNAIWNKIISLSNVKSGAAAGLGYYVVSQKDAGTYTYSLDLTLADLPQNDNYSVNLFVRTGSLEILPVDLTVTTGSAEKVYDGTPLTKDEVTLDGIVEADQDKVKGTATGTQTEVGDSSNTYTIDWGGVNQNNYSIVSEELGTLTVTGATLTVTVKDIEKVYNGQEQEGRPFVATVTGTGETIETDDYTVEGLGKGDVLTITYTPAKGTDVGPTYTGEFSETFTITNAAGEDAAENYDELTFNPGNLTITQVYVTLTIEKTWEKPADVTEPDVSFTVTGDDGTSKTAEIESGKTSVTVEELPVSKEGGTVSYTVTETVPTGYAQTSKEGDTFTAEIDGEYTAKFTNTKADADYIVEFYYQNDDATTYPDEPEAFETRSDKTGEEVSVTDDDKADKEGGKYTYDTEAANVESAILAADGTTVLKLYFKLNEADYTVEFYYQDENLEYQKAENLTDTRTGIIAQTVAVTDDDKAQTTYKGNEYTLNEGESTLSATMAVSGTVLKLYFDLKAEAELTVEKTANPESGVDVNDTVTYTVVVTNSGNVKVSGITLEDTLVPLTVAAFDLAVGESKTITYTYTVVQADVDKGQIDNEVTATGTDPNKKEVSASDEATVKTVEAEAKLSITKKADPTSDVAVGDTITYTVVVTNAGNVTVTDGKLEDDHADLSGETFELVPGEAATFTYTYTVTQEDFDEGEIVNTVTANASAIRGEDPDEVSATATVTAADTAAELDITKEADPAEGVVVGDEITYTVVVTNIGDVSVEAGALEDDHADLSGETFELAPDESATFTYTYTVTQEDFDAGEIVNVVTANATAVRGDDPEEVEATATVTAEETSAEISVTKEADPTSDVAVGDEITYTVVVTNTGDVSVEAGTLEDDHADLSAETFELAPEESATFTYTYTVTQEDINAGEIVNTVKANATAVRGDDPEEAEATATVTAEEASAEISITKEADPTSDVAVGDTITYTVVVTNTGNVAVEDGTLEDDHADLSAETFELAPEESATFTYTYTVTQDDVDAGEIVNTVVANAKAVRGEDPEEVEASATVTAEEAAAELDITKEADPTSGVVVGDTITYTVVVTNIGNVSVEDGTLDDDHVDLSAETFDLAPEESATFTYTYTVTQEDFDAGEIVNTVTATASAIRGEDPDEVSATATVTAAPAAAALKITKEAASDGYEVGDTITFTVSVENIGNVTIEDITLVDDHADLSDRSFDPMEPGGGIEITYTYVATQEDFDAGFVTNTVTANGTAVRGEDPEEVSATATVTAAAAEAELSVEKTADPTTVDAAGATITYTVVVTNTGNVTLKDGKLADDHADLSSKTFELAPEETAEFTYTYTVTQDDMDEGEIVNTVKANATAVRGENPEEATATATVTVEADPHLTVTKETTSTTPDEGYALGDTITYKITVENDGNQTIFNVSIVDELEGFAFDEGQTVSGITLKPGESASATGSYVVTEDDLYNGEVVNVATAEGETKKGDPPEVDPGEDPEPTEDPKPHLTVYKETTSTTPEEGYALGDTITYKIWVENDGNVTVTDVVVTDDLTGDEWTVGTLKPGQKSEEFETSYVVTEDDIIAGVVLNVATAEGKTKGDPPEVTPGEDPEPPEDQKPHMTVTKKTTSTPKSSEGYALGETITYEITVENDGNLTISNISIIDELPGFEFDEGQTVTGITLKPGEKTSVTGSYVVTMDDVIAGEVVNEATAEGETKGDPPEITPGKDPEPTAKLKLVIESATHNWTYNGAAHTDLSYKVTLDGKPVKGTSATEFDLGNGVKLNITPNGATVTHVTDSKNKNNKFTWTITKDGEDAKAAFTVTEKVGTLRILPRTVIMTSGSAAKQFDGLPLVNGALYITGEGFVSGEGASWIVYGAQTQIGWSYNFFTYTLNAGTRASDYNIIPYFGTLFVMGEELIVIEDFETPLGLAGVYNNLGECFE